MHEDTTPLYEICVRGALGEGLLRAFPALDGTACGAVTQLTGALDQAALFGALAQIERFGVELLSVRRLP